MRKGKQIRPPRVHRQQITPQPAQKPFQVLLALRSVDEARLLLPLAEILAADREGRLLILHASIVQEGEPLSVTAAEASRGREELVKLLSRRDLGIVQIKTLVLAENEIWDGIWQTVAQEQIDLLVFAWGTPVMESTLVDQNVDARLAAPPCDIVSVYFNPHLAQAGRWDSMEKILLPVRGGANSALTLRVGSALANHSGANITLLHATQQGTRRAEERLMDEFSPALHALERITRSVTTKDEIPNAINREANDYQLVVMGAPSRDVHPDGWNGPILDEVLARTKTPLIIVKQHQEPFSPPIGQEQLEAGVIDRPVAVVVDKWFAENTYHSREFADIERLVTLKQDQGLTISLCLPALNEEATVGNVIKTVKTTLMEEIPLLDEIILIDSGSVDYTREIAGDLGIPVYIHQEILPELGSAHGKGEALWKSLYVLKGDLIAWIDTDIKNIHPRFVYGVLGPLLRVPHIQYVKGFYRRPLIQGERVVAGGGGRVTELTARPLFNLFYPELSGLIQPLSGEYAGRRDALERLPFFTGYGVETGLLIDILEEFGLEGLAQVDLLERIHHNQPLPSLSKMSFVIMQVFLNRLERRHRIQLMEQANLTMNLIRVGPRRYYLEPEEIRERERPPMRLIPQYCQKFDLPGLEHERFNYNDDGDYFIKREIL
jgi:nucleotide-binding universal stress UspA family protein